MENAGLEAHVITQEQDAPRQQQCAMQQTHPARAPKARTATQEVLIHAAMEWHATQEELQEALPQQ